MSGQQRKQFTVTREMLTAVARHLSVTWLFVFHRFDPFALLYNKSLNDFVSGNIEILGKQNSPFHSGPVIKCLIKHASLETAEHFQTWGGWGSLLSQGVSQLVFSKMYFAFFVCKNKLPCDICSVQCVRNSTLTVWGPLIVAFWRHEFCWELRKWFLYL